MRTRTFRTPAVRPSLPPAFVLAAVLRRFMALLDSRASGGRLAREHPLAMDLDQRVRETGEW